MHITSEILEACAGNDRRAQKQLYEYCYRGLMNVCMRYYSNAEDARFAFNNGFLKIINGLQAVDLEEINFPAWSKRIMVNALIDEYRKNKNHQSLIFAKETDRELEIHASNSVNSGEQEMDYEAIMSLLKTIPPISAHVFTLYVIDGYNHKEIGEILEITEGTSKWHLSTARKQLRDRLEDLELLNEKRFAI
jgi:RNA polymerase sigma factor (sigma-70 family)